MTLVDYAFDGREFKLAYADESGALSFNIYVLSAEEVPIVAVELKPDGTKKLLKGAVIELSNSKGKVVVTTNEQGFAPAKIRSIADDSRSGLAEYYCFAQIKGIGPASLKNAAVFRMYEEYTYFLSGQHADNKGVMHNTIRVPFQRMSDPYAPYLSEMSFDGPDMQYTKREICVHPQNDIDHIITLTLQNAGHSPWNFSFNINGKAVATAVSSTPVTGSVTVEMKGQWLKQGSYMNVGDKISISYWQQNAATKTTVDSLIEIGQGKLAIPDGLDENHEISVAGGAKKRGEASKQTTVVPDWMKKQKFVWSCSLPFFPVEFFGDQFNNVGATLNLPGCTIAKCENGKFKTLESKDRWKIYTPASCVENFENKLKDNVDKLRRSEMVPENDKRPFTTTSATSLWDTSAELGGIGYGKAAEIVRSGQKVEQTTMAVGLTFQFLSKFESVHPFFVWFIPMFWGWDMMINIYMQYVGNARWDTELWQNFEWFVTPNDPNLTIMIEYEAGINVGVGVKCLIGASIRGYAAIRNIHQIYHEGVRYRNVCYIVAGVGASVFILFFSKNIKLAETPPKFLDCYPPEEKPKLEAELSDYRGKFEQRNDANFLDLTQGDFPVLSKEEFEIITEDALECCTELYCYLNEKGHEGTLVDGEWLPDYANWCEGFEPNYTEDSSFKMIDPFNPPDGQKKYNPIHGLKVESELICKSVYGDLKIKTTPAWGGYSNLFTIVLVKIKANSAESADGFSIVNETYDGKTFPYVVSPDEICAQDSEAARVAQSTSTVASNAEYVIRPRIIERKWGGKGDSLLTFSGIPDRVNTWDVDFDIATFKGRRYAAITSTRRPIGTKKDLESVFNTQFVTFVAFDEEVYGERETIVHSVTDDFGEKYITWSPHVFALSDPTITANRKWIAAVVYYMLQKGADISETKIAFNMLYSSDDGSFPIFDPVPTVIKIPNRIEGILAEGNLEVCTLRMDKKEANIKNGPYDEKYKPGEASNILFSWSVGKTEKHNAFAVFWLAGKENEAITIENASSVLLIPSQYGYHTLRYVVARNFGEGDTKQILLVEVKTNIDPRNSKITVRKVANNTALTNFCTLSDKSRVHDYEYCPPPLTAIRIMDGEVPPLPESVQSEIANGSKVYAATGPCSSPYANLDEEGTQSGGKVKMYQMMRADWIEFENRYTDFYPIALLDHAPESIWHFDSGVAPHHATFTYYYTSKEKSSDVNASLYKVQISTQLGIRLDRVRALSDFCMAGDVCPMHITVTSLSNDKIGSFSLKIRDAALSSFDSFSIKGLQDCQLDDISEYVEVLDENGKPTGKRELSKEYPFPRAYLYPGQTRTYLVYPRLPKGVQGNRKIMIWLDFPQRNNDGANGGAENNLNYVKDPFAYELDYDSVTGKISVIDTDLHPSQETTSSVGDAAKQDVEGKKN